MCPSPLAGVIAFTSLKPHHLRMGVASPQREGEGQYRWTERAAACHLSCLSCLLAFPSQLQAHMALQLCPLLGDHMYSARVATVLGQRFLLPAESTRPQRQVPKPTCWLPFGVGWGWGWRASPDISYAAWASIAPCSPVLLCGPEQMKPPLLGLFLPICSIRKSNWLISKGPSKSAILFDIRGKRGCVCLFG